MKINSEQLQVVPLTHDEKGEKIEPEQAPARRLLDVSDTITLTGRGGEVQSTAVMPMSVSVEMPAGELARGFSQPCFSCKNFDLAAWGEYLEARKATVDGRAELQALQEEFIRGAGADAGDADFTFRMMGVCRILSEAQRDVVAVHPASTCPDQLKDGSPFPRSYRPRTSDDERQSSATFDSIMRTAQGRR
jgi:hypothetical protein